MEISVIVCTFNRSTSLARCLSHLSAQKVPTGISWEIVVVDNNSTDNTPQVVKQAAKGGLPVHYIREEKQGLCYARNCGIEKSRGEIVAYIDDDILTKPDWLAGMLSAFSETASDAVGGRIHLDLGGRPLPKWLAPNLWGYLGYIDHGEKRVALDGQHYYPHGGNMAFCRDIFERVGLFDVAIGRKGNKLYKGSETEFFYRLSLAGAKMIYEPSAWVHHIVKAWELKKRHFRNLQFLGGVQRGLRDTTTYERSIRGVPFWLVREFVEAIRDYFYAIVESSGVRFRREMELWEYLGYARGVSRLIEAHHRENSFRK